MPVDKFGRMKKDDFQAVVEGVSLNYVNKNFIRKGDKIDMGGNSVVNLRDPVHHQDAATMNYVVSTIERIMSDYIQNAAYDGTVTKTYVDDQVSSRKPMITVYAEENGPLSDFPRSEGIKKLDKQSTFILAICSPRNLFLLLVH